MAIAYRRAVAGSVRSRALLVEFTTSMTTSRIAKALMKVPIHVYRYTFKPLVGGQCRHWPTCSDYALQAIELNGAWRGFWLALSRFVRCGPGGTHGVDPVPDIRSVRYVLQPWRYGRWR